ncbi:MAG: prolipoprotein diacylglyceryl transferase [Spirochaetota bacterium]|nr:prolipoprotein diacylglyceryl transferase [Spirochaetota bacterium]
MTVPHFVHRIDPVLLEAFGIKLYFYGLAYALGFLGVYAWLRWRQERLCWSTGEILTFTILFAACALVFGRAFDVLVYEWKYYSSHLSQLPVLWGGGIASHGVILGAIVGTWLFSRLRNKDFLSIVDDMVVPAACFLGLGRIGNFINGQIYGHITNAWWAVKFPGVEGFRHPVALYESLKNFMIIPILLHVRKKARPGRGVMFADFFFWYGFLRLFTDCFREYGTEQLGIGTGQYFNLLMVLIGLALIIRYSRPALSPAAVRQKHGYAYRPPERRERRSRSGWLDTKLILNMERLILITILILSLAIPSSWTLHAIHNRWASGNSEQTDTARMNSSYRY